MRSLRLVPYWSVHETLGVDAHNAPLKMRTRRIHLSRAVAWSCVRRHPVAGAALGSTDVEGSDPPGRGPGAGAGPCAFSHPAPAPWGRSHPSVPCGKATGQARHKPTSAPGLGLLRWLDDDPPAPAFEHIAASTNRELALLDQGPETVGYQLSVPVSLNGGLSGEPLGERVSMGQASGLPAGSLDRARTAHRLQSCSAIPATRPTAVRGRSPMNTSSTLSAILVHPSAYYAT